MARRMMNRKIMREMEVCKDLALLFLHHLVFQILLHLDASAEITVFDTYRESWGFTTLKVL